MLMLSQTVLLSRVRRTGLLVLLLLVLVSGLAATEASACNPNRTPNSNFRGEDGATAGPGLGPNPLPYCVNGAEGVVYTKQPYVETHNDSGDYTSEWVGLYNTTYGTIGQTGYFMYPDGSLNGFGEVANGTIVIAKRTWASPGAQQLVDYQVTFTGGNQTFHVWQNGNLYYDWKLPAQYQPYNGCTVAYSGETHDQNSQMPGRVSDPESWLVERLQDDGGSWHNTVPWQDLYDQTTNTFYGNSILQNQPPYGYTWDKACS
jgi:hypothetical protein